MGAIGFIIGLPFMVIGGILWFVGMIIYILLYVHQHKLSYISFINDVHLFKKIDLTYEIDFKIV
jgi:hypothetical protein